MQLLKNTFDRNLKLEVKFLIFFISLIPLLLVTGPFLPDLILTISVIIFIYISIKEKLVKYYINPFFLIFLIFWIIIVFKSIYIESSLDLQGLPGQIMDDNPYLSLKSTLPYIRFALFVNCVIYLVNLNANFIKFFGLVLIATLLFVIFDGLFQYIFNFNIFGMEIAKSKGAAEEATFVYVTSFFGDEKILGSYLSRLFPLALFFICMFKNLNIQKYHLKEIFLLLLACTVILTTERVAIILCLITVVFSFFTSNDFYKRKYLFLLLIFFFVILSVLIFNDSLLFNKVFYSTLSQLGISENKTIESSSYIFSKTHQEYYNISLKIFFDNVFFGSGVKMYRIVCHLPEYFIIHGCNTHPHHTLIQILSENGIFIFILFLLIITFVCISIFKYMFIEKNKTSISDQRFLLLTCFFLTFFPLVPSGSFFNNWLSIIYYMPLGFYLAELNYFKNKKLIK